jgi:hypothetical protein
MYQVNTKLIKKCIECNTPIVGRSDKKFCSYSCRNSYNNRVNSINNSYMQSINNVLKRNRKILEEIGSCKPMKINKRRLLQKGFSFQYYTNINRSKNGTTYYCYDYGYAHVENDTYCIVKVECLEESQM